MPISIAASVSTSAVTRPSSRSAARYPPIRIAASVSTGTPAGHVSRSLARSSSR
ncbi:hypothetical protein [Catellatospora tritici]|uniref:hypothetical protein n=1 Tax=Catellatospora tritici TaxID=2851566 RepID=UPI001C2D2D3E|nr:hypothetical protein [Catellatospora tritici]MBV1855550.1 hypothetical protein [Catellatospora tritici]